MKPTLSEMFPKKWNAIEDKESKEIITDLQHGVAQPRKLATAKPAAAKKETMSARKAQIAEHIDGFGNAKNVMTFTGEKHSNVSNASTQLSRYRNANRLAHLQCGTDELKDGFKIQFTGTELKPGSEIFIVATDGLDPASDGIFLTKGFQVFSVKAGKVEAEIKAGQPATGVLKAARLAADAQMVANDPTLEAKRATERHNAFMHKMKV
jgi:hypothetical protein